MAWYDEKDALNWVEVEPEEGILHVNEWMEHVPMDYMEFFLHVAREVFKEYYSLRLIDEQNKEIYVAEVCHQLKMGPYGLMPLPTSPYTH